MSKAVCDAGPLIHLSEIKKLELLNQFDPLLIPEKVLAEAASVSGWQSLRFEKIIVERASFQTLNPITAKYLHAGEIEALALLSFHPDATFISDDLDARREAARLGYSVTGSVGVVVRAYKDKLINRKDAEIALEGLADSSLFITGAVMEKAYALLRHSQKS